MHHSPGPFRLRVAALTGQGIPRNQLARLAVEAVLAADHVTVGDCLHDLADALPVRGFRRHPLAKQRSARVPATITLSDPGVRNAILRGAPSLTESDPTVLGRSPRPSPGP